MKKFQYMYVYKVDMKEIIRLGMEGWEMCGIVQDQSFCDKEFWFKKEISTIDYTRLLIDCAYKRGIPQLQHRIIHQFAQFVEDVMSDKPEYEKYRTFDINSTDAIEQWIQKFHDYYEDEFGNIKDELLENEIKALKELEKDK